MFFILLLCVAVMLGGCRRATPNPSPSPTPTTPAIEDTGMRGVWLSYIELDEMLADADPATAKKRIEDAVKSCRQAGLNTVFFHLRAHGDAYYPSNVWPAATAAKAVMTQGFDPLACAIKAARECGMEIHGWINPYRIGDTPATDAVCFQKGGTWYYAPNDPAARRPVVEGAREILENYDVDGIHFDDYFYPGGMAATSEAFENIPPDTDVTLWRQTQVDALVSAVYGLCHQHGKVFGVSPMADPARCRTEAYADVTRWMTEAGYIDYICPQIYTGFRHQSKPFSDVLSQWAELPRRQEVALYIGLALYKVGLENDPYAGPGADEWAQDKDIISRQIALAESVADGYALFRYGNLNEQEF